MAEMTTRAWPAQADLLAFRPRRLMKRETLDAPNGAAQGLIPPTITPHAEAFPSCTDCAA